MEKLNESFGKICSASERGKKGVLVDLQTVSKIRDEFWALEQRAEAAEAKLAGLEKQEPAGYAVKRFDNGKFGSWLKSKGLAKGDADYYVVPLFERPAPAADLVPEGWKLVRVEPTKQMLEASYREASVYSPTAYRAMLAAAPTPNE